MPFINILRKEFDTLKPFKTRAGSYEIKMSCLDSDILFALLGLLKQGGFYVTGIFDENGSLDYEHEINDLSDYYVVYHRRNMEDAREYLADKNHIDLFAKVFQKYSLDYKKYIKNDEGTPKVCYAVSLDDYHNNMKVQNALDELIYKGMFYINNTNGYSLGICIRNLGGKDCFVLCELKDVAC